MHRLHLKVPKTNIVISIILHSPPKISNIVCALSVYIALYCIFCFEQICHVDCYNGNFILKLTKISFSVILQTTHYNTLQNLISRSVNTGPRFQHIECDGNRNGWTRCRKDEFPNKLGLVIGNHLPVTTSVLDSQSHYPLTSIEQHAQSPLPNTLILLLLEYWCETHWSVVSTQFTFLLSVAVVN